MPAEATASLRRADSAGLQGLGRRRGATPPPPSFLKVGNDTRTPQPASEPEGKPGPQAWCQCAAVSSSRPTLSPNRTRARCQIRRGPLVASSSKYPKSALPTRSRLATPSRAHWPAGSESLSRRNRRRGARALKCHGMQLGGPGPMTPGVPATLSGIRPLRRAEQPYSRLMVAPLPLAVCAVQDRSLAGQPASGVWYSAEVRGHEKCPVLLMRFRFSLK